MTRPVSGSSTPTPVAAPRPAAATTAVDPTIKEVGVSPARLANGQLGEGWAAVAEAPSTVDPAHIASVEGQAPRLSTSTTDLLRTMQEDIYTNPALTDAQRAEMHGAYLRNLQEGGPIGLKQPFSEFSDDVRAIYASRGLANEELVVQGSAVNNASSKGGGFRFSDGGLKASDIDVAARVSPERFNELAMQSIREMQQQGKIPASVQSLDDLQALDASTLSRGARGFRNNLQNGVIRAYNIPGGDPKVSVLQEDLTAAASRKVQMSVVEQGGNFDTPSRLPLRPEGVGAAGEAGEAATLARTTGEVADAAPGASRVAGETAEVASGAGRLATVARYGGGALAVGGGGIQMAVGVSELADGKIVDGSADLTAGAANTTSGVALLAGAGTLAAGAGGVGAVIDGGRDVINGIREGDGEKITVGGVKTAAGAMMIAGAATANPILMVGGAATYVGATVYQHREAIGNAISSAADATVDFAGRAADTVATGVSNAVSATGEALSAGWKRFTGWFG
ncbi:MAG: hypothetical protein AB7S38_30065 [Vulcanimicrobiota bacterium]